jgi:hypothetical protein
MLTRMLREMYDDYKANTSTFLKWLSVTAQQCGQQSPSKAASSQHQSVKSSLKEITSTVEAIIGSGKAAMQIPSSVAAIAKSAISARKSFSRDLQQQGWLKPSNASDLSHAHFADFLEHALRKLTAKTSASRHLHATVSEVNDDFLPQGLSNRFAGLEIEDTQQGIRH